MTKIGRKVGRKDGQYNPTIWFTVAVRTVDESLENYHRALAQIDEQEVQTTRDFSNAAVEYHNVGSGVGRWFDHTSEIKPKKYKEAINGPNGEAWKQKIKNKQDRILKNKVFKAAGKKDRR